MRPLVLHCWVEGLLAGLLAGRGAGSCTHLVAAVMLGRRLCQGTVYVCVLWGRLGTVAC
jgi:hypothetical protein